MAQRSGLEPSNFLLPLDAGTNICFIRRHAITRDPWGPCSSRSGHAVVVWFFTAQWCSRLIDRVYTVPMVVVQPAPFGWNGTYLQFGSAIPGVLGLTGFNRGEQLTGC
jgi:hypothetical protein